MMTGLVAARLGTSFASGVLAARSREAHDTSAGLGTMRQLKVVIRSARGGAPVILLAGVLSTEACGKTTSNEAASDGQSGSTVSSGTTVSSSAGGAASSGTTAVTGSTGAGGSVLVPIGSTTTGSVDPVGGAGGALPELPWYCYYEQVSIPPEGTPAEPGQICALSAAPVESNRAAVVRLTMESPQAEEASGFVEIAPEIRDRVVGVSELVIVDANLPALLDIQVSDLVEEADGYSFRATGFNPLGGGGPYGARMTVRVVLEIECDGDATQQVHAVTELYFCENAQRDYDWTSSGDHCVVCEVIAEMAPSPIVPDKQHDGLPLARALRLRLVALARIANTVVLLAENDGGPDLDYEFHTSCGTLTRLAEDVVAWTVEAGARDPLLQAAVSGPDVLGVVSYSFNNGVVA